MQKVLRRTALAERQALRRRKIRRSKYASEKQVLDLQEAIVHKRSILQSLKDARITRREDWQLGPLAPKRDVGTKKDTYGTSDTRKLRGLELPESERVKNWPIAAGDRVVLVEGRDKGKIGVVESIRKETNELTVKGLNITEFTIPQHMLINENDKRPTRAIEAPVLLSSVRLVYPLRDRKTGVVRDVIVENPIPTKIMRYVPGIRMSIPWPPTEPEKHDDHDDDTLRMEVEAKTWVPTLLRPPMPPSVIDELRNKFSVFRTRHDEDYIAKMMEEDVEKEKRRGMRAKMRTPVKELNRKERAEKRARGKPKLREDMLAKIGEVIASKRGSEGLREARPS